MRNLKVVVLLVMILFLQGCPKWIVFTIHNNTKTEFIIELSGEQLLWKAGTTLYLDKEIERKMQWVNENGYVLPLLKVRKGETLLVYKLQRPGRLVPTEYIKQSSGKGFKSGTQEYRFQLEENGNLYIVKSDQKFPADTKSQPFGFPIEPGTEKSQ